MCGDFGGCGHGQPGSRQRFGDFLSYVLLRGWVEFIEPIICGSIILPQQKEKMEIIFSSSLI